MTIRVIFSAAAIAAMAQTVSAAHGNSWAGGDDAPLGPNHDANQSRSIDTPGEDEMNGDGARSAHGKSGTTPNGGTASDNSGLGEGGGPGGSAAAGAGNGGWGGNR